jgi:hypothetical protein
MVWFFFVLFFFVPAFCLFTTCENKRDATRKKTGTNNLKFWLRPYGNTDGSQKCGKMEDLKGLKRAEQQPLKHGGKIGVA